MSLPVNNRPEPDEEDDPGERPPVPRYVVLVVDALDPVPGWDFYYEGDDFDEASHFYASCRRRYPHVVLLRCEEVAR